MVKTTNQHWLVLLIWEKTGVGVSVIEHKLARASCQICNLHLLIGTSWSFCFRKTRITFEIIWVYLIHTIQMAGTPSSRAAKDWGQGFLRWRCRSQIWRRIHVSLDNSRVSGTNPNPFKRPFYWFILRLSDLKAIKLKYWGYRGYLGIGESFRILHDIMLSLVVQNICWCHFSLEEPLFNQ